jgi:ATP-binding cassette, subfamily B, bacterial
VKLPVNQYLALLSKYLAPQKRRVTVLGVFVVLGMALQVASPQLISRFIDRALAGNPSSELQVLAAAFIALAVLAQVFAVAASYLSANIGWASTNALRSDLIEHCLRLDMTFHKTRTPGELIQRVDGDVSELSAFFSSFVIYFAANVLLLLGVLVTLYFTDWSIGLALTLFSVVAMVALLPLHSYAVRCWMRLREEASSFYGFLSEHIGGTEDLRGNGATGYSLGKYREHLHTWQPAAVNAHVAGGMLWMSSLAVFAVGNAIALAVSFFLWRDGSLSIGGVYLVFHYTEMLRQPIDRIREQMQNLQNAEASILRVKTLLEIESVIVDDGTRSLPDGALAVDIDGVGFAYEAPDDVLHDVSLHLQPGQVLGMLGRTGSGKTTVGRLLVRLYDVERGSIELSGVPIRDVPLSQLRQRVGVVSQDVQVFEGMVRDNLTLFDDGVPDARLIAALTALGLGSWLESLPDGLDSRLSSGGLSAGEAQLLACARLFLADPGLVVLDEATSRLDPATQRLVDVAVGGLLEGRTAIIIAHRLTTLDRADVIAVLEDGVVVEQGERLTLLADPTSRFATLRAMEAEAVAP